MNKDTEAVIKPLIATLTSSFQLEVRVAPTSGEYLEAVLRRPELSRCFDAFSAALGPPVKDFGKVGTFDRDVKRIVDALGGIRPDQCLFAKSLPGQQMVYAALWPWASDATKVTIKVGATPPP